MKGPMGGSIIVHNCPLLDISVGVMYSGERREVVEEEATFDKQVAAGLAKVMAAITFFMTYSWASKDEKGYLGGLEWDDPDKVFNWYI